MSNNNINSVLQRKLSPGLAYNKLIEKTGCKVTRLGDGNTYFSIDKIKEYSLKFQHQTEAVVALLVKKSLVETVNSFYKFCYDHFQYKADGEKQNIKSPACAWHSRNEGMDCKSFSVLASTLCSNAGLKHYIRKIKQPFFHPDQYTHVYVIVPNDQKTGELTNGYYVIDGTTHDNQEAVFIEKHDTFMDKMPHYGLNAPRKTRIHPIGSKVAQKAINSCGRLKPGFTYNKGGRSITQHGLNGGVGLNGADVSAQISVMCKFAQQLREAGVHPQITSEIIKRIKEHVAKGIDPAIVIGPDGIIIEGELFHFFKHNATPKLDGFFIEKRKGTGLNSADDNSFFDNIIADLTNEDSGWFSGLLSSIGDLFSCWGCASKPKDVENFFKNIAGPYFSNALVQLSNIPGSNVTALAAASNKLSKDLATARANREYKAATFTCDCSKKSALKMAEFIIAIQTRVEQAYQQMAADYTITGQNAHFNAGAEPPLAQNWTGGWEGFAGKTVPTMYVSRTFVLKPGATGGFPQVSLPPTTKPSTGGTITLPSTGGTTTPISTAKPVGIAPPIQQAGMNWLLIAALAGGLVFGAKHLKNQTKKK